MNNTLKPVYTVAIAGGGPVGLFLAIALQKRGIECVVFEKRTERITHSRSLGIHPVSLELMEQTGIVNDFLKAGINIEKGIAHNGKKEIGTISFRSCPKPYTFVLSLPQFKTEELLEKQLNKLKPGCLVRGAEVLDFRETGHSVEVRVRLNDKVQKVECDFLTGCDGKNSRVRESAGFTFRGNSYSDTYIMGDFSDNTIFGTDAAIFLCKEGLIESFPLSDNRRRWVVKTDAFVEKVGRLLLEKLVAERIGHDIGEEEHFMLSSFGVQKYVADPVSRGRIFLAGDAAHIVSPIGGQGMNLGWLDVWDLTRTIDKALNNPPEISSLAVRYSTRRIKAAKKAIRRAELNMALGRATKAPVLRNALVWMMLNTPLQRLMARIFTMRGLSI